MNIDAALRYEPIVKRLPNDKKVKIIEVGSGVNGITDFYTGVVVGVDNNFAKTRQFKNKQMIHKKGSVTKIPAPAQSFDIAICVDTFEHLSPKVRIKAIKELLRVVKADGQIFLSFPTGQLNVYLEQILNWLFFLTHGYNHPWLEEHLKYGLPSKIEIQDQFELNHVRKIKQISNLNSFVWLMMHLFLTVLEGKKGYQQIRRCQKVLYWLGRLNLPPYYRVILVVQK